MTEVPIKYELDVAFKFIAFCTDQPNRDQPNTDQPYTDQPNWMCLKATSGKKKNFRESSMSA